MDVRVNREQDGSVAGASLSEATMRARAVLLVRDEALRETIGTILGGLSNMLLSVVDTAEEARHALRERPSPVFVVAPAWRDRAIEALLRELTPSGVATVIVSASIEHRALAADGAVFVHAPFDVDSLLDAIDAALGMHRHSCTQPIAR
jgi:DNA-binding NtrC family response regulator